MNINYKKYGFLLPHGITPLLFINSSHPLPTFSPTHLQFFSTAVGWIYFFYLKLGLLFIRLYHIKKLPNVNPNLIKEIDLLVKSLSSEIDPGIKNITVLVHKEGFINKTGNPSQIRGIIMSSIIKLSNKYSENLDNIVGQMTKDINLSVLNVFKSVIKPFEKDLIDLHDNIFKFNN